MFKDGRSTRGATECKGGGSSEVCQGHALHYKCAFFPLKPNPCHVAGSKDRKSKTKLLSQKGTTGGKEVAQGQQV